MKIDQSIVDRQGRILIARGSLLEDYLIEALLKLGIGGVYIVEGTADELPEESAAKLKQTNPEALPIDKKTQETIEKLSVQDRKKVQLSESVKKRVAEGMQFLYSNTEADNFMEATDNITNELMKSITDNDAVAVDISILKVSDEYTFKHSVDVATMAMVVAKQHGMSKSEIRDIGMAGILHDVGKTKIPNEILNKPGKLTDEEFTIMKNHPVYGYKILKEKPEMSNDILLGVLQHHEKMNGKGYPMGVSSDKIGKFARIISVVDVYDALVTERPYKKAFTPRDAVEMIMSMTADMDINAMKSFMKSVILYPVGSVVQLSNGEPAKVVENNVEYLLRPKVVGLVSGKVYDLSGDLACANIIIE
jgi:HD-GYP domain-containing protein (c-di-GMP phosphodiesterase class II)